MFALENAKEIEKLSKNYLQTKGISFVQYVSNICAENFHIDELFLVMVSRRYKTHICVVLQQWERDVIQILCPTARNQVPSGVDETSTRKVKGPDASLSRNWQTSCQRVEMVRVFLFQRKGS